jgi:hypothetical protein
VGSLPVRRRWVLATSVGAALAWSIGMLPSTLGGLSWTPRTVIAVGMGALILLGSLPTAQYVLLRDHVSRAIWWIPINMAAWLVGIAWTLLPSPWIDQTTPTSSLIMIYGIAGLCTAATVAVITGLGMIRFLRPIGAARSASPGVRPQRITASPSSAIRNRARKVSFHECPDRPSAGIKASPGLLRCPPAWRG